MRYRFILESAPLDVFLSFLNVFSLHSKVGLVMRLLKSVYAWPPFVGCIEFSLADTDFE